MPILKMCECGCGEPTRIPDRNRFALGQIKGIPLRFKHGHNARHKNGFRLAGVNYLRMYRPDHEHSFSDGSVQIHTLVATAALGHALPPKAEVHHVNEDKMDNSNHNLVICQDRAYHLLLHARARVKRHGGNPNTQAICSHCHIVKDREFFSRSRSSWTGRSRWCRECNRECRKDKQGDLSVSV